MIVAGSSFLWFFNLLALYFISGIHGSSEIYASQHGKVVACYIESWAVYRPEGGKFGVEDIRPEYCTHLIYSFAGLNPKTWEIISLDPNLDLGKAGYYKKLTGLRRKYPHLKISLAIGGWNEGSETYSNMTASPSHRNTFISSVVDFLSKHDFDGLDLDWEYPADRGGAPQDKENFVLLVKELKSAFTKKDLLLTAAIGAPKRTIDTSYDIPGISEYLDYIHIMSYDYHGLWDRKVMAHAPLRGDDGLSAEASVEYLLSKGAPPGKLVLGMPFYGKSFILTSELKNSGGSPFGAAIKDTASEGPYTKQKGFFGYNEICKILMDKPNEWRKGWEDAVDTAYITNGIDVIVFDDDKSITRKIEYLKKKNLAGVMIWAFDHDDFRGDCAKLHKDIFYNHTSTELNYPLMKVINNALTNPEDRTHNDNKTNDSMNNNIDNNNNSRSTVESPTQDEQQDRRPINNKVPESTNNKNNNNNSSSSIGLPYLSSMIFLLKISVILLMSF